MMDISKIRHKPAGAASDRKSQIWTRTRTKKASTLDSAHATCSICQEPVGQRTPNGDKETWHALPCGHRFGGLCIKTWLGTAEHPSCPICRVQMTHTCGHPVLPMPVRSSSSTASSSNNNNGSSSSHNSNGNSNGNTIAIANSNGNGNTNGNGKPWRGLDLNGMCGFCAVRGKRWPVRLALACERAVVPRRMRMKRSQPLVMPLVYSDDEDPWQAAFISWWVHQDPKPMPQPTPEMKANAGVGYLVL